MSNTWIEQPVAASGGVGAFEHPKGHFSPLANSVTVLQRRGAVFCACHNEVWELTMGMLRHQS